METESRLNTKAPPNERGGNRHVQPTATASHSDSTIFARQSSIPATAGLPSAADDTLQRGELAKSANNGLLGDQTFGAPLGR